MKKIKVLFGFEDTNFEKGISDLLRTADYEAEIAARFSLVSVKEYLEKNPDTVAVVLQETFQRSDKKKCTAEDFASLTETSDVNVIPVISGKNKGTDYMRSLFAAGITSAIFTSSKGGVSPKMVASLIVKKRSRKSAREYYGLESEVMEYQILSNDDYSELYDKLKSDDNMLDNLLILCKELTPKQAFDFIKRLPEDDKEFLAQFEDYHRIAEGLNAYGYDLKIRRPKKFNINQTATAQISVKEDRIEVIKEDTPVSEEKKKKGLFGRRKSVAEVEEDVKDVAEDEKTENVAPVTEVKKAEEEDKPSELSKPESVPFDLSDFASYDEEDDDDDEDYATIPSFISEVKNEPVKEEPDLYASLMQMAADASEKKKEEKAAGRKPVVGKPFMVPEPEVEVTKEPKAEPVKEAKEEPVVETPKQVEKEIIEEPKAEPKLQKPEKKTSKKEEKKALKEKAVDVKKASKEPIPFVKPVGDSLFYEDEEEDLFFELDDEEYVLLSSEKRGLSLGCVVAMILLAVAIGFVLFIGKTNGMILF